MQFNSFEDFYLYYLSQHQNKWCRLLHVVGTGLGLIFLAFCLINSLYKLIPLSLVFGYGFSWFGHFIFERNKPAAFSYPVYSFVSDFRMLYEVLSRKRGLTD
jgi:hypothetical protein